MNAAQLDAYIHTEQYLAHLRQERPSATDEELAPLVRAYHREYANAEQLARMGLILHPGLDERFEPANFTPTEEVPARA